MKAEEVNDGEDKEEIEDEDEGFASIRYCW